MSIFDDARNGTLVGARLDFAFKNNPKLFEQQEPGTGYTPLAIAVVAGLSDEIYQLLKKGARADGLSRDGETPLLLATWKTTKERKLIVQRLLEKAPSGSVDRTCDAASNKTPLMYAIEKKDLDCIRMLRKAGASLKIKNDDGFNAKEEAENLNDKAVMRALDPEKEQSALGKLAAVVVSFLLYIVAAVNNLFKNVVQRATRGLNPALDQKTDQAVNRTPPATRDEFVENVGNFVKDNAVLERFFKDKPDFVKNLAKKATELEKDKTSVLGCKDLLPKTIKVSMHQQVIYCDDSSSMKRQDRWENQKKLVQRIAKITTRILPEGEGVALRFINQVVDNTSNLTLDGLGQILGPLSWDPNGDTPIGTELRKKILEPLVYSKIQSQSFDRPLLVSIITDGMPSKEDKNELVNAILQCGKALENAGYPRESVKFVIGQIGTAEQATRFIESLGNNSDIAPVAFIISDKLDEKLASYHANDGELDRWLIETLFSPIKDAK